MLHVYHIYIPYTNDSKYLHKKFAISVHTGGIPIETVKERKVQKMISISIVSILCSLYFLQSRIRYVTAASVFTAYVGNATDSASGYCNVDPIACNLRAAWNTCLSLSSGSPSECFIHVSVSSPLYIDSTLGALSLTIPGVSISIIGNNSTILSRTNSLGASR